jgi:hypothetical protein
MPCLCSANTLRLFIRGVAQVDLPASTTFASPGHLQKSSFRSFGSAPAFRAQHLYARRAYSSASRSSNDHIDPSPSSHSESESTVEETKLWPQETGEAQSANGGIAEIDNAFVDLSVEAIDAIAAESRAQATLIQEEYFPVKGLAEPQRKAVIARENDLLAKALSGKVLSKNAKRKLKRAVDHETRIKNVATGVEHAGFKLNSSSPREPAIGREFGADTGSSSRFTITREHAQRPAQNDWTPPEREPWQINKAALKEKFPDGWKPLKRLSPDAMAGIRALHSQMPEKYTTKVLAESFQVSPEMIRRILKSKWRPSPEEETDRQRRWFKRGENVWSRYAELGVKPPKKWRDMGIGKGKPEWKKSQSEQRVVPALVTTARRRDDKYGAGGEAGPVSLEDRIL